MQSSKVPSVLCNSPETLTGEHLTIIDLSDRVVN